MRTLKKIIKEVNTNKIKEFLKQYKPDEEILDDDLHKFAEDNGLNVHDVESEIYKMARKSLKEQESIKDITPDEVQKLADENNIDLSKYNMDQVVAGYKVEREHDKSGEYDVVKNPVDPLKIALAHLDELPDYYTKLNKMENESIVKITSLKEILNNVQTK